MTVLEVNIIDVMEWSGALCGLYGAYILAKKDSIIGWYLFLAANVFMIAFAFTQNHFGLLLQQIGFLGTSSYGIYNRKRKAVSAKSTGLKLSQLSVEQYYETLECKTHCPQAKNFEMCSECLKVT